MDNIDALSTFFSIAWGFWYRHNKKMYDQVVLEPRQVVEHALSLQEWFSIAQGCPKSDVKKLCRWTLPPVGFLKLNVDGAMFRDQHKAGVGAILRDENGSVIMAVSKVELAVHAPEDIELLAMFQGLQLCIPLGIKKVVIESDCLLMVRELQASEESSSRLGALLYKPRN